MLVSTQLPHPATHTHTHVYCIICILLYLFHSLTVEYHSRLSNSWSVLLMVSKLSWCYIKQMSIRVYTLFKYRVQQQLLCKGNLEKYPVSMQSLIFLLSIIDTIMWLHSYSGILSILDSPKINLQFLGPQFSLSSESCLPWVPEQGTVGASGDLAPLSHLALGMMGEGKMWSPKSGWSDAELVSLNWKN